MNLLITGAWNSTSQQQKVLTDLGHRVVFMQNEKDPLPVPPQEIDAIICNGLFLHHPIEQFTSLKYIQLTSAGFDRVPLHYIHQQNITLHNARGVYSAPMAEFAIGGVLAIYKEFNMFYEQQKEHLWKKRRDLAELSNKTVCIVGCGSVGQACAKRFAAFDCTVLGIDLTAEQRPHFHEVNIIDELSNALKKSDIIVLTLPLTERTHHLFDQKMFDFLKDDAILVNIARGSIVETAALENALQNGKLLGAVLDVFETEPLSTDSPLWTLSNVILTPHNSFIGDGNGERLFSVILKNLKEFLL